MFRQFVISTMASPVRWFTGGRVALLFFGNHMLMHRLKTDATHSSGLGASCYWTETWFQRWRTWPEVVSCFQKLSPAVIFVSACAMGADSSCTDEIAFPNGAIQQIVGRERRGRVSQLDSSGDGCVNSRRRVNSTVMCLNIISRMTLPALIWLLLPAISVQTQQTSVIDFP